MGRRAPAGRASRSYAVTVTPPIRTWRGRGLFHQSNRPRHLFREAGAAYGQRRSQPCRPTHGYYFVEGPVGPSDKQMTVLRRRQMETTCRFPDGAAADFTKRVLRARKPTSAPFLAFCAFPGPHSLGWCQKSPVLRACSAPGAGALLQHTHRGGKPPRRQARRPAQPSGRGSSRPAIRRRFGPIALVS